MGASVVWSETPDEEGDKSAPPEEPGESGELDESLPTRRLRHWLKAMFGGRPQPPDDGRES